MTDRDRLIEEAQHEFEALANMSYTGWRPDITGDGVRRIRELLCDLVHALQDCERERDEIAVLHAEELARLRDANEARLAAEQRVKELTEALHAECRHDIGECYAPQPLIDILAASPPLPEEQE